jgi:O-antigen/teichoic acid export membrane protein
VFTGRGEASLRSLHQIAVRLTVLIGAAVALVAAVVLVLAGDALLPGMPREWSLAGLGLVPASMYANVWTGLMIGARRVVEVSAVSLTMTAVALAANLIFVASTRDPAIAIAIFATILALQTAVMFAIAARMTGHRHHLQGGAATSVRAVVMFGARGYPGTVSGLIWSRAAVFVLNATHGPTAVGIFSVAQQLAEKTLLPIQAMQDVIFSRMAGLPKEEATATLNRYLRVTLAATAPTIVVLLVVSPLLVTVLFSEAFRGSVGPLRLLLLGSAVQTVPMLLASYFLGQLRRPLLLSFLAWLNAVINLVLLVALVPAGAEIGAAAAIVATQIIGTIVVFTLYLRMANTDLLSAVALRSDDIALVRSQALRLIRR